MPGPKTKYTRLRSPKGGKEWSNNAPLSGPPTGYFNFETQTKDELLITAGHAYRELGKSASNIGGPFLVIKRELVADVQIPTRYYRRGSGVTTKRYITPFSAIGPIAVSDWPAAILPNNTVLDGLGTTAIANTIPTNPLSGLFVAVGELKTEGLPLTPGIQTWRSRTLSAKNAGSEYLNKEFGWLPLISDMKKFAYVVQNQQKLIAQYERGSGVLIKRSFKFPTTITTSTTEEVGSGFTHVIPHPPIIGIFNGTNGTVKRYTTDRVKTERWFEAAYTYYLPPYQPGGDNLRRTTQIANYLYGTRVTPEGIWNLTPWTWALDWVANVGDVLHNISAFQNDGLVMQRGYIMEKVTHEKEITYNPLTTNDYPSNKEESCHAVLRTTVKSRRGATPYGFGLDPSGFSTRQKAILLALGFSRS